MAHDIDWYGPERGRGSVEDVVSHLPATRNKLRLTATKIYFQAQLELAVHRRTGSAKIVLEGAPPHLLDWYVLLKDRDPGGKGKSGKNTLDRSAMSIEFGWTQTHAFGKRLKKPIKHDGLHILGKVYGGMRSI